LREFWQGFWCSIVLAGGWLVGYWYGVGHENWPYDARVQLEQWVSWLAGVLSAVATAANHLF
jgi:hypothetical protein